MVDMKNAAGKKTAVVVGALGVIGRYIVERLAGSPDWQVVGLSRRRGEDRGNVRYLSVDLLDPVDLDVENVTHVFFAAFQGTDGKASGYAENIAPNRDMLMNSVTDIERKSPALKRVVLVTGTKYYGTHLGAFKTPARETDPRHAGANYYFDQIDWLTAFQRGKPWTWTELRPQTLCGFAPGTAMSIVPVIAVYAAMMKELGRPFAFPGRKGAGRAIYQVTDSGHFANAALWAATDPRCANQAYNITNGDYFRWLDLWPKLASVFDMPAADPHPLPLTAHGIHGGQGAAMGCDGEKARPQAMALRRGRRLALRRLCVQYRLGRDVEPDEMPPARLSRRGRQRGDVRAPAHPVSRRTDRSLMTVGVRRLT
jgi:nucleoside-diphosphate-sugar epimerase